MSKIRYEIIAHVFDKRHKLLSTGHNSYTKTHPKQKEAACAVGHNEKIYLHAEIDALIKIKNKKAYSIHIYRYDKHELLKNAFPCPICLNIILKYGIKQIFYSTNENSIAKITL